MARPIRLNDVARRILRLTPDEQRRALPLVKQLYGGTPPPPPARGPVPTIIEVMESPDWCADWFTGPTWEAWKAFLCGVFGLPMTAERLAIWTECTQRHEAPTTPATEAFLVVGRRGGKSYIVAFIAVYLACFRDYLPHLSRGEWATIPVISADKKEARTVMRYVKGFLDHPKLAPRVVKSSAESVELINRMQIEVHVARFKAVRSYTVAAAICDEIAFWETGEDSASPDSEVLNALRPAMGTIPGAVLLGLSSPYARAGVLWEMYAEHFGKPDPEIVWQAQTVRMNPRFDQTLIAKAYEKDPDAAGAEYGAEFRRDIESFISRDAVNACVVPGRYELPRVTGVSYFAFVDPSGGSQDAMTLAIAHRAPNGHAILDVVRERTPQFNPDDVVREFVTTLARYGVSRVTGDRYGGEWPAERFRAHGIGYDAADKTKSQYYLELLPQVNSQQVELLDHPRLIAQLCTLERRTARGGHDSVDHPPRGHDDLINAAAGALTRAASGSTGFVVHLLHEPACTPRGSMRSQVAEAFPHLFEKPSNLTCGQCVGRELRNGAPWCALRRLGICDADIACTACDLRA